MATENTIFGKHIQDWIKQLYNKCKELIKAHDDDKSSHINGFNHDLVVETGNEPTIKTKYTSSTIGGGSVVAGTIGFTDANDKWIGFIDAECINTNTALEVHVNNPTNPGNAYQLATVCRFCVSEDGECYIDGNNNKLKNIGIVECNHHITLSTSEVSNDNGDSIKPYLYIRSGSNIGSSNPKHGAIVFSDKSNTTISVIEATGSTSSTILRIKVSPTTETGSSSSAGYSLCEFTVGKYVNELDTPFINVLDRYIANARLHSGEIRNDESFVNKKYVDDKFAELESRINAIESKLS